MFLKLLRALRRKPHKNLPFGVKVVGGVQMGQNCFSFVLEKPRAIGRREFSRLLDEMGFEYVGGECSGLEEGDIVAYYKVDPEFGGFEHASIYVGKGKVRGIFGLDGKVVEHSIEKMPDNYFVPELGICYNAYRRNKSTS